MPGCDAVNSGIDNSMSSGSIESEALQPIKRNAIVTGSGTGKTRQDQALVG